MKRKSFFVALIIVILSWMGNYIYFQKNKIESPILLSSYVNPEKYSDEGNYEFPIYYLTNKDDSEEIIRFNIGIIDINNDNLNSMDEDDFGWDGLDEPWSSSLHQEFRHQVLKKAVFKLDEGDLRYMKFNHFSKKDVENAWVEFSDGKIVPAKLKEFTLPYHKKETKTLEWIGSGAQENNQYVTYIAQATLKMEQPVLTKEIEAIGKLEVTSNQKARKNIKWPLTLKKGDRVTVNWQTPLYTDYSMSLRIPWKGKEKNGSSVLTYIDILNIPSMDQKMVDVLKEEAQR